jgi:hypothetical protein
MPAAQKFNDYSEQKNRGVHNWGSHVFKLFLTNTAPAAANTILSDITQLTTGGGYTGGAGGGVALSGVTIAETGGTTTVQANQVVVTATGAAIGPFRYYGIYNDTAAAPVDALVLFWDHGSAVTLNDGDSFTVKFNNASPGTIFTDS